MPATVSVMYPAKPDATFDLEYYKNKHMALVTEKWSPFGLKNYYVTDLRQTEQPYIIQAVLIWDSLEAFQKAVAAHGPEVMGDIGNFTNVQPVLLSGDVVKSLI